MAGAGWSRMEQVYRQGGWPQPGAGVTLMELWDALAAEAELAQAEGFLPVTQLDQLTPSAESVAVSDRFLGPPITEPRSLVLATPHGPPVALSPRDLPIEEAVAV
jgi:hypothetical protein